MSSSSSFSSSSSSSTCCRKIVPIPRLVVKCSAKIHHKLNVLGNLFVKKNAEIGNNITVGGNATIGGNVSVAGSIIGKLAFPTIIITTGPYLVTATDFVILVNAGIPVQLPNLSQGQEVVIKNITPDQPVTIVSVNGTTLFDGKNNTIILAPNRSIRFHLYNTVWYALEAF